MCFDDLASAYFVFVNLDELVGFTNSRYDGPGLILNAIPETELIFFCLLNVGGVNGIARRSIEHAVPPGA